MEAKSDIVQIVVFSIEDENYGLEILKVQEVLRLPTITHLPKAPSYIKGVINRLGDVIPVIDLREKFGLEPLEYTEVTRVVIVGIKGKKIGMIVDTVNKVLRVKAEEIQPSPPIVSGLASEYTSGVVNYNDQLIVLLQIDRILSEEDIIYLEKAKDAVV